MPTVDVYIAPLEGVHVYKSASASKQLRASWGVVADDASCWRNGLGLLPSSRLGDNVRDPVNCFYFACCKTCHIRYHAASITLYVGFNVISEYQKTQSCSCPWLKRTQVSQEEIILNSLTLYRLETRPASNCPGGCLFFFGNHAHCAICFS